MSASLAHEKRVTSFELRKKDLALDRSSKLRRLVVLKIDKKPERNSGSHAGIRTHDVRGLSMEGNLRFKIDWTSLIVGRKFTVLLFYFVFKGNFQLQAPGGLIFAGVDSTEGFLRVWGRYNWRRLHMGGLIFGILRKLN